MYKILVIEDDNFLRCNISELLSSEGYIAEAAENGKIGLEKARNIIPDLIISDIMMPELSGFEVLEELQKDPNTAIIPFIFLTAKVERENLRKGMNLGADDYLSKPFDLENLLLTIEARLKRKEDNKRQLTAMQEQISLKVPHELRTPLMHILGYSEIIEDEEDIEQIREMVKKINASGKVLQDHVEKLLLYQKLVIAQSKKGYINNKTRSTINEDSVSAVISKLPVSLKAKERVNIKVEEQTIAINEGFLAQTIKELVENALQYSDPESPVFVMGYTSSNLYIITVSDSGRGMSANEIDSISAYNKFGEGKLFDQGLGLGLAIVQKIAELHGGSLTIKSELNKFTTCEVALALN